MTASPGDAALVGSVADLPCDVAQGFLFGRPGTAAEVTDVLPARTAATADPV